MEQHHLDLVLLKAEGKCKIAVRQLGGSLYELTDEFSNPHHALLALAEGIKGTVKTAKVASEDEPQPPQSNWQQQAKP